VALGVPEERWPSNYIATDRSCLAIGCADPVVPRGAWMRRDGDKATVACNYTTQTWHIVCQHDSWFGSVDNCTVGT